MDNKNKIIELKDKIDKTFLSIIGRKCIHVDAPYYQNIGDVLIWHGCQYFYKQNNIKCIYSRSHETFDFPNISYDTTICFNGGGNLGDLYPEHITLLKKIIEHYPDNKIIVFPQTIFYHDKTKQDIDFKALLKHGNLYLTARDINVYSTIKPYFGDYALLAPDMAFYIPPVKLGTYPEGHGNLLISRKDCESSNKNLSSKNATIADWPVLIERVRKTTLLNKLFKHISEYKIPLISTTNNLLWNWYAYKFHQHLMISEGINFIKPYNKITTTRLHGCILSILVDKQQIELIDNSYGKNKDFYNTWLTNLETLKLIV